MDAAVSLETRVFSAAANCAARVGLDAVAIEDIIRLSGVPRTTLYRRFGNREAILRAMLIHEARPYFAQIAAIARTARPFRERVEQILIVGIASLGSYGWAQMIIANGLSAASLSLFQSIYDGPSGGTLLLLMQTAADDGALRPGLTPDKIMPWLVRQIIELGCALASQPDAVHDAVRRFILPVLFPDAPTEDPTSATLNARLDRMEAQLVAIAAKLG